MEGISFIVTHAVMSLAGQGGGVCVWGVSACHSRARALCRCRLEPPPETPHLCATMSRWSSHGLARLLERLLLLLRGRAAAAAAAQDVVRVDRGEGVERLEGDEGGRERHVLGHALGRRGVPHEEPPKGRELRRPRIALPQEPLQADLPVRALVTLLRPRNSDDASARVHGRVRRRVSSCQSTDRERRAK